MKSVLNLMSPETGASYVILIEAPPLKTSPGPWPVMLFMDGDDQFSIALAAYREARAAGSVPPTLLVGVGYGASYNKALNKRGRDYTPTAHSDEPSSGGATAFVRFLKATLWPELERRFPLHREFRGIAGHSLGSLLVLTALWQEPIFFTHYLASAPSIWWHNRSILALAAERQARNEALSAKLFLCVGAEDTASMVGDLALLENQLIARPFTGLTWVVRRFARRNHFNVLPEAFHGGLIFLLAGH